MRRLQKITLSLLDLGNNDEATPQATPESTPQRLNRHSDGGVGGEGAARVAAAVRSADANTGSSNDASSSSSSSQHPRSELHTRAPLDRRNNHHGRSPSPAPTAASEGSAAVASIQRAAAQSGRHCATANKTSLGGGSALGASQDYPSQYSHYQHHSMPTAHVAPSASSETTRLSSEEADRLGELLKDSNGTFGDFESAATEDGNSGYSRQFGYSRHSAPTSKAALAQQEALLNAAAAANHSHDTGDDYGYDDQEEEEEEEDFEIEIESKDRASEEYPQGYRGEGYPARYRGYPPAGQQRKPYQHQDHQQQQHYYQHEEGDQGGDELQNCHRGGKFDVEYYEENGYADYYEEGMNDEEEEHYEKEMHGNARDAGFVNDGFNEGGDYEEEEEPVEYDDQWSRDDEAAAERFNFGDHGGGVDGAPLPPSSRARADSEDIDEVNIDMRMCNDACFLVLFAILHIFSASSSIFFARSNAMCHVNSSDFFHKVMDCLAEVAHSWPDPKAFFNCYAATPLSSAPRRRGQPPVELGLDISQLEELLRDVLASVGAHGVPVDLLRDVAEAIDEDQDGIVTYAEFLNAVALE